MKERGRGKESQINMTLGKKWNFTSSERKPIILIKKELSLDAKLSIMVTDMFRIKPKIKIYGWA